MADAWTVVFEGWDPADEGRAEALCTLGNGRFATRGAAPESAADGVHYPGTYAAGCYNRSRDEIAGRHVENESVVNLPNWRTCASRSSDGDWVDLSPGTCVEHRLALDLRRGLLDPRGAVRRCRGPTHVDASAALRAHGAAVPGGSAHGVHGRELERQASGRVGHRRPVANSGVARYRDLAGRHLESSAPGNPTRARSCWSARTTRSQVLDRRGRQDHGTVPGRGVPECGPPRLRAGRGHALPGDGPRSCAPASPVAVEKIVALVTSRDLAVAEPAIAAV